MRTSEILEDRRDSGFISLRDLFTVLGIAGIVAYGLDHRGEPTQDQRQNVTTTLPSPEVVGSVPLDASIQTVTVTLSPEDQAILDAIEAHHSGSSVAEVSSTSEVAPSEEAVATTHPEHAPDSTVQTVVTQGSVAPETTHNHPAPATNTTVQSAPNTTAHSGNHEPAATTTVAPVQSSPVVTQPVSPETVPATPSGTVPIPAG